MTFSGRALPNLAQVFAEFERVQFSWIDAYGTFCIFFAASRCSAVLAADSGCSASAACSERRPIIRSHPKQPHFPAKAKRVIFLFMNGGMSQVDTFDPKPMLTKYHGQAAPGGNPKTERKTGSLMQSPFAFRRCGQSGIEVSEIFPEDRRARR